MLMVWAQASPSEAQQRCLERSPWASEEFRVSSRPLQLGVPGSHAERSSTPSTALADNSLEVQASPSEATADGPRMQEVADKERLVVEMLEMGAMAKTSPSSPVHLGTRRRRRSGPLCARSSRSSQIWSSSCQASASASAAAPPPTPHTIATLELSQYRTALQRQRFCHLNTARRCSHSTCSISIPHGAAERALVDFVFCAGHS